MRYILDSTRIIDLSFNNLDEIPSAVFRLPYLFDLQLAGNQLKTINQEIINSPIGRLNLSSNPIESLPKLPYNLEELFISDCNLKNLDILSENKNLVVLVASCNKLSQIPFISSLQEVDLSYNRFLEFPKLPNTIISLDLSFNEIQFFPDKFNCPNLVTLDVSFNLIQYIPNFIQYPNLKQLNLASTQFQNELNVSEELTHLDLTNTQINRFSSTGKFYFTSAKSEGYHERYITDSIYYASTIAFPTFFGDIIISRIFKDNKHPKLLGIVDNRKNYPNTNYFSNYLIDNVEKYGISDKNLKKSIEEALDHLEMKNVHEYVSAAFVSTKGKQLIVSSVGGMAVFVKFSNKIIQICGNLPFTLFCSRHKTYGSIGSDKDAAMYYVHNIKEKAETYKMDVSEDMKFVIIVSMSIVDTLMSKTIEKIILDAADGPEIAARLKSACKSSMCSDNISVLVAYIPSLLK